MDNQPPEITVNGNNPATVQVGVIYADLGAMISSPASDKNLGITALIDNATSTNGTVTIDTSTAGTHAIEYRAFDQHGLMGSTTRAVVVQAAANDNPPPAATSTPPAANDNPPATTTAATSTGS
jgi:hypothetical protein